MLVNRITKEANGISPNNSRLKEYVYTGRNAVPNKLAMTIFKGVYILKGYMNSKKSTNV